MSVVRGFIRRSRAATISAYPMNAEGGRTASAFAVWNPYAMESPRAR